MLSSAQKSARIGWAVKYWVMVVTGLIGEDVSTNNDWSHTRWIGYAQAPLPATKNLGFPFAQRRRWIVAYLGVERDGVAGRPAGTRSSVL